MAEALITYENDEKAGPAEIRVTLSIMENRNVLVLIRGLPGSGKSEMAQRILKNTVGYNKCTREQHIFSADDYFIKDGIYLFNPRLLHKAHEVTQRKSYEAMYAGINPVIIDNTNIEIIHMEPYITCALSFGYKVEVLDTSTSWRFNTEELSKRNRHGVSKQKIENMLTKYIADLSTAEIMNLCNIEPTCIEDIQKTNGEVLNNNPQPEKKSLLDISDNDWFTHYSKITKIPDTNQNIEEAWGISTETLKSWNIVKLLDDVVNEKRECFSEATSTNHNLTSTITTTDASTITKNEDFLDYNDKKLSSNLKILYGRNRCITTSGFGPVLKSPPKKLTLDKGCQTAGEWKNDFEDITVLCDLFPNISINVIQNYYNTNGKDLQHTIDQLLKVASSLNYDTNISHEVLSDEQYTTDIDYDSFDLVPDVKSLDLHQDETESARTSESDLSDESNTTVTLSLGEQTIVELENMFPDIAKQCELDKIKNIQPIIELPRYLAQQIFEQLIISVRRQNEEFVRLENLLLSEKDELCAKQLQEFENKQFAEECMKDFVVQDHTLSNRIEAGLSDEEKSDPESLIIALTMRKLRYHFPGVSDEKLHEVIQKNDNDYIGTVEELKSHWNLNPNTIHSVRDPPLPATLFKEVKDDYKNSRFLKLKENKVMDPNMFRNEAFRHIYMRNVFMKKAEKYRRNVEMIGLGEYYMYHVHEQSKFIERANTLACTGWVEIKTMNFTLIDLHFLYVTEAINHLDIFLDINIRILRNERSENTMVLSVITGRGNNSRDNVPKVRIAVEQRLKIRKISYKYAKNNHGLLKITINKNSKYSNQIGGKHGISIT